jgi:Mrp family chromosome partitioning ATPase/capsular polysaccharide biosynthesis protein
VAALDPAVVHTADESRGSRRAGLGRLAKALRDHAIAIAIAVVAVTILAYGLSLTAGKRYRATARIVADTSAASSPADTSAASRPAGADARRLATNLALVNSVPVLDAAAVRLRRRDRSSLVGKVTASAAPDADVIAITADGGDPEGAAAVANAVAGAFLSRRAADQRAAIAHTLGAVTAQTALLAPAPDRAPEVAALRARADDLVVEEASAGNDLLLADAAQPPSRAYAPRPLRAAMWAFLAALVAAVLVVALREWRRPAPSARDVERRAGVPLLAALPALPPASVSDRALEALVARAPPRLRELVAGLAARRRRARAERRELVRTATEDGLRSLLAATLLTLPPGDRHVILVTSAGRGEHSAHVAAGLARGLAQAGQETLVLSSDLASPQLADALGVASAPGLSQALEQAQTGTAARLRAVPVPGLDALHVVPGGGPPHDGVGLVRPGAVEELFVALGASGYGYIVVDAPALLVAPEGCLVARLADAAIVASPENPSPEELAEVRRALERLDVRVLGAVSLTTNQVGEPRRASGRFLRAGS